MGQQGHFALTEHCIFYHIIFKIVSNTEICKKLCSCFTFRNEGHEQVLKVFVLTTLWRMYIDSSIKCCPVSLLMTAEIYPTLYDDNTGRPQKHSGRLQGANSTTTLSHLYIYYVSFGRCEGSKILPVLDEYMRHFSYRGHNARVLREIFSITLYKFRFCNHDTQN